MNTPTPTPTPAPTTLPDRLEMDHWFEHGRTFSTDQGQRLTDLHTKARELALLMLSTLPARPETEQALLRLQESVAWANTSVSRE